MNYIFKDKTITSEEDLRQLTGPELSELYSEVTGEPAKRFADKTAAIKKILPIIEQISAPTRKVRPVATSRSSLHPDTKIVLLEQTNPKRPGSAAHLRYESYRTVKTVGEWKAKGYPISDLTWDSAENRKHIRLEAPK